MISSIFKNNFIFILVHKPRVKESGKIKTKNIILQKIIIFVWPQKKTNSFFRTPWHYKFPEKIFHVYILYIKTQRKVMSDSRKFFANFCNFFSIGSLSGLEKYVSHKFSLCLFSKKNLEFVCFPPFYPFFQKS